MAAWPPQCRLLALIISCTGISALSLFYIMSPSPSYFVHSTPPKRSQKVSAFLCLHQTSIEQLLTLHTKLQEVFQHMKLDHETFIVVNSTKHANHLLRSLSSRYHHTEILYSHTCHKMFSKAHYSVLLMIGSNVTSFYDTIPKLIKPIIKGQSDLTFATDVTTGSSSLWEKILLLLVSPLTGCIDVPSNTRVWSMLTPIWIHSCHDITDEGGSLPVEMITKCSFSTWSTVSASLVLNNNDSLSSINVSQVISLWWYFHPLLVTIFSSFIIVLILLFAVKQTKHNSRHHYHGSKLLTLLVLW